LVHLDVDGSTVIKLIFKMFGVMAWSGLNWMRIVLSDEVMNRHVP